MRKTDFTQEMHNQWNTRHGLPRRLNHKQAWYKETKDLIVLQSYDTLVAALHKSTNTLVVLDRYSITTQKHIYAFSDRVKPTRILYCYRRSDGLLEKGIKHYANDIKPTRALFNEHAALEFTGFIPCI